MMPQDPSMKPPMPPEGGAPAPGGAAPTEGGDGAKVGEKLVLLSQALSSLAEGMGGSKSIPPEAAEALQAASENYNKFLSIAGQQMGIELPDVKTGGGPLPSNAPEAQGSKNAVPADMSMGRKGTRPVPVG